MKRRIETIGNCTLYLGDAREVLQEIGPQADACVITDPVWPNAPAGMFPVAKPHKLLEATLSRAKWAKRAAIIMRYDSDPRFLKAVPGCWPFFRISHLPYVLPSKLGRTLGGMEVVYAFGTPIKSAEGRHIVPGVGPSAQPGSNDKMGHPCPRAQVHINWVVNWYSDQHETVIDPFMGSGTTGAACVLGARKFIGIELEEKYFDIACRRIEKTKHEPCMFTHYAPRQKQERLPMQGGKIRFQAKCGDYVISNDGMTLVHVHAAPRGSTFEGICYDTGDLSALWDKAKFQKLPLA
jgi:hypothetical protein